MPVTYPPPPAQQVGDTIEIHQLLQSPALIERRVRDIAMNRFIADVLLPQNLPSTAGAVAYQQGESQYTERDVEVVTPGSEYPRTGVGFGPQQMAQVQKWGQEIPITDEAIANLRMSPVNRALVKLVNQLVKKIDTLGLAAIVSQVTASIAATSPWMGNAPMILRDVLRAVAEMRDLNEGFEPDTLVVDDLLWAFIASDPTLQLAMAREAANNPVYSGEFNVLGGLRLLPTPNLPAFGAGGVLVVDSAQLGGMADQDLGGDYTGALRGIQTKVKREGTTTDGYDVRGRRVTVPVVLEPQAGIVITGARS